MIGMEKVEHFQMPSPEPYRVEVERGQKGSYGWSIRAIGQDPLLIIEQVKAMDEKLRRMFLEA
jgi:hypothetical protein